jgi:hypothetical protein
LRNQITLWQNNSHVKVVCAVGVLDANHYPPFNRFGLNAPIASEERINLIPINIKTVSFSTLTERVLYFRRVYQQNPDIKNKSDRSKLCTKFINYCQLLDGNESSYRTILFLADRYLSLHEDLFSQPVAILLKGFFYTGYKKEKIDKIANSAVDFLLDSKKAKLNPFFLKSDAFLDFFFALSYVNFITQEKEVKLPKEELSRFDSIFTARINRFVVQLMCADRNTEGKAIKFIIDNYNNMPF